MKKHPNWFNLMRSILIYNPLHVINLFEKLNKYLNKEIKKIYTRINNYRLIQPIKTVFFTLNLYKKFVFLTLVILRKINYLITWNIFSLYRKISIKFHCSYTSIP